MIVHNEFDYVTLPGYADLTEEQQRVIKTEYERGYMSGTHLGVKLATGRGYETAKLALESFKKAKAPKEQQPTPPSIFDGLDNCR